MMSRRALLPHPWLSLFLVVVWQLIMNDLSAGSLIMGFLLAWLIPLVTHVFWPNPPTLCKPGVLLRFTLRVLGDIVTANLDVAKLILGSSSKLQPAFVEYPVELTDPFAIHLLASTISLTPGTVSAELSEDHRTLLIHALNVTDEPLLIATIKQRYERPLMEVFACSSS
ncbi:MAG: Na+/H+ antiporter subunit E [Gammaproteobacteria bacterium HGW-Gammaproteobacteria-11]|nr:MAG: Na+/H+ antiporter subunit E [Gammaproteobacteria bacterium HGW-Gammaproteobacteria-11]